MPPENSLSATRFTIGDFDVSLQKFLESLIFEFPIISLIKRANGKMMKCKNILNLDFNVQNGVR